MSHVTDFSVWSFSRDPFHQVINNIEKFFVSWHLWCCCNNHSRDKINHPPLPLYSKGFVSSTERKGDKERHISDVKLVINKNHTRSLLLFPLLIVVYEVLFVVDRIELWTIVYVCVCVCVTNEWDIVEEKMIN